MKTLLKLSGFAVVCLALVVAAPSRDSASRAKTAPPSAGKFLALVAETGSGSISSFQIDPATGALSRVNGSPFKAGRGPEFLASDGKYVYTANSDSNDISGFAIDPATGALRPVPGTPFSVGLRPKGVALASAVGLLFVVNTGNNTISVLRIDSSTGTLTQLGTPTRAGSGPFDIAVNPAGTFLYATDHNSNLVSGFAIDSATGGLTPVPNSPFQTGQTPMGILANPAGSLLYVVDHMQVVNQNRPQGSIASFRIDQGNGSLTRLAGVISPQVKCGSACHMEPLRIAIHPSRQFAYSSNVATGSVSPFLLHTNGSLSPISGPVATGARPFGLAFDPQGHFLYVVNKADNTISGFAVNRTSGRLSVLAGSPFRVDGHAPRGIVTVSAP